MKSTAYHFLFFAFILGAFYCPGQGLTLDPGTMMTIGNGGKVTIDHTGKITIKSTASGSGSLVVDADINSNISPAGGAVVEQYLSGSQWHLVSSPVSSDTSGGPYFGDYLYRWDESTTARVNVVTPNFPLTTLEGFFADSYPSPATAVYTASGVNALNNGSTGPYSLTRKDDNASSGYNLVGNPYPCSVNWMEASGWTRTNISNEFWIYQDVDGTIEHGRYAYFNGAGSGDSLLGGRRFIAPTQGFWVNVITGHTTGSLTVNNAARVHGNASFLKKATSVTGNSLRITSLENDLKDEMVVKFIKGASVNEDEYDGHKLFGGSDLPQIYSDSPVNGPLCINALPDVISNVTVSLSFKHGHNSSCMLLFDNVSSFSPQATILLEDLKLNCTQDLRKNSVYNFSYDIKDSPNRFLLHFNDPEAIQQLQDGDVQVYSYQDKVYVKSLNRINLNGEITIYSMIGNELFKSSLVTGTLNKFQPGLARGYYLVKVVTDNSVCSRKIFLNR